MLNNELENTSNKKFSTKNIKIIDIDKVDNYLFVTLDNGQKILTDGKDLYDVSDYNHLSDMFNMGDKFCAVMTEGYSLCVVDLKTMEVLFEDEKSYHISKQDDRTLHIIMKIGGGNDTIYDIETKKYLPAPNNYEFEKSLGNYLYVFREKNNTYTNFYDYKRCVINANGKIILKDIDGWIELSDNHLVIEKKDKLCVVKMNEDFTLDMKTIEKNEKGISKPIYHNGKIIIIEKGIIKIYTPDFELTNKFIVDGLKEIVDYEIVSDTLKLCLPYLVDEKQVNKHLYINLNTGKSISHVRIEGYPYWMPTIYIGYDSIDSEIKDYHFYNAAFDSMIKVSANSYEDIDSNKKCMFVIRTSDNENERKQLLNAENGYIRDIDYDYIHFHPSLPYGYGVNFSANKMDFFDENLNILIPDFDYKKFDLNFHWHEFNYFIVHGYICIQKHFVNSYGEYGLRTIIQNTNGEMILDSVQHKCYALGNFIQIIHNNISEFLNTLTGEIGPLMITTNIDSETGKLDIKNINNINNILSIDSNERLMIIATQDEQESSVKKLVPNT